MINRWATLLFTATFLISLQANADTVLGIYAGGGSIDYDLTGDFQDLDNNGDEIDLEDDLDLKGESGQYFYIALEHFIPLIPNIRVARSEIEESSRTQLSRAISFDGITFPQGTAVVTDMDFSHTDFTFYYELLDNWVNLDLGLTARQLDGELAVASSGQQASEDLDFVAPLFYGKAQFDLPLTGLYVAAEGNWIGIGDAQLFDLWGKVGYSFAFGLGLELGVRKLAFELDDVDGIDADVSLSGTYAAATFHF